MNKCYTILSLFKLNGLFLLLVISLSAFGQLIEYNKVGYYPKDSLKIIWKQKNIPRSIVNIKHGITIYRETPMSREFGVKFPYVDKGKVLLCFFAAGCDHCMSTIRSLDSLRTIYVDDFPKIEILFMEEETEKIPEFFEFAGSEYHYQILDIPTFYDVLTWERDTPGVFYIWNGNIQASYNGINDNAFNVTDLLEALDKKY